MPDGFESLGSQNKKIGHCCTDGHVERRAALPLPRCPHGPAAVRGGWPGGKQGRGAGAAASGSRLGQGAGTPRDARRQRQSPTGPRSLRVGTAAPQAQQRLAARSPGSPSLSRGSSPAAPALTPPTPSASTIRRPPRGSRFSHQGELVLLRGKGLAVELCLVFAVLVLGL